MSLTDKTRWEQFKENSLKWMLAPAALVILYVFFGIFGRNFFSYPSLVNIIDAAYYIGFISVGVTFVIITGGIDLSVGTIMMSGAIIGGTTYKVWGWPIGLSLLLIIVVCTIYGYFNGVMVSRVGMPPFIVTLGTMMISMGIGSIVSNVRSATFPTRTHPDGDGWFKSFFKYINEDGLTIPTGAFLLLLVVIVSHIILTQTKMGRYIYAIGSNKEAARLSGVNVARWETSAYIVAGVCAGIGGISYAAVYTTVLPAAGQGFELYAIAGAVIGGTSLSGGMGSVFGTLIGVFIMSTLSVGLPSLDLQAHYQTFFTGVVVIGAVLLDMYRNKRTSEIRILSPAEHYRIEKLAEIRRLKAERRELKSSGASLNSVNAKIQRLASEMKETWKKMKKEEKAQEQKTRSEEKQTEKAIHQ